MNKNHVAAKKYLMQIRRFDRAINHQLLEVAYLRALAASVSAASDGERVQVSPTNRLENSIIKILEEEKKANDMIDRFVAKKKEIVAEIESITDIDASYVLILYFVYDIKFDKMPEKANMSRSKIMYCYKNGLEEFYNKFSYKFNQV